MSFILFPDLVRLLSQGLQDDGFELDWTAMGSFGKGSAPVNARIVAKSDGIWVTSELCQAVTEVARLQGLRLEARCKFPSGARFKKGAIVCEWKGDARAIHALERPFLNLAQYIGGIALQTSSLVVKVEKAWKKLGKKKQGAHSIPRVTATRKTLPHYRNVAIASVIAGGGYSHRVNLSGGILIKENHIRSAGGIARAIEGVKRLSPHSLKIEIEVTNQKELGTAVDSGAEVVMLDNFKASEVKRALRFLEQKTVKPQIEVSGGITEGTISSFVLPGVDLISVGSLTHSVRAIDLSLLVQ